jgi:K+-sensing histidine kinase KdpD
MQYAPMCYFSGDENGKGKMKTRTRPSIQEDFVIVECVARVVSSVRGRSPDYTLLAAELELAIPFDVVGIVLLRHDREGVRVTVCHREEHQGVTHWTPLYLQHPRESSMLAQILQVPVLVVREYENGLDGPPALCGDALSSDHRLHSTLIVPLIVEERVLGTLELGTVAPNTYRDEALQRLVSAVARVLAAAIEGVQLEGKTQIQDRQHQALKDVSYALTSKMELPTILDQIVVGLVRSLNAAAAIVMYDRQKALLRVEALAGLDRETFQKICTCNACVREECIIGYTIQHRRPATCYDLTTDVRFPLNHLDARELNIHSVYTFPLMTDTTVYGVLLLCSAEPGGFTPLKADIFSLFASQATLAIDTSTLLEAVRQRSLLQESALLSSVSHDLRTPLTTIKAAVTGLLQADIAWSEQTRREVLEDVDSETDQLTVMVNALIELSRIEMGALVLEKEWCDIVEVIHGAQTKLDRRLAVYPMCLDLPPHLPLVYADHAQLERVFYNLIDNAMRHSPEGAEIVIAVDVLEDRASPRVRVCVADHGRAVPEHERERIFRAFHYGCRSYGSGLGLAVCKGIVEAHQGCIWVEAVQNDAGKARGSCFIFTLPVRANSVVSARATV